MYIFRLYVFDFPLLVLFLLINNVGRHVNDIDCVSVNRFVLVDAVQRLKIKL